MPRRQHIPPIRHLVLWLTTACNLSCSYCYREEAGTGQVMPLSTALAALEMAAKGGEPFKLQLAGGEPTLQPGLIEALAMEVQKRGWPARLAIQTNAACLTHPLAQMLAKWKIAVGVSLDGPPQVHDCLRGGFSATLRGMYLLEKAGVEFGVTAVVCAANLQELPQLALLLSHFSNARGLGLDLLVQRGRATDGALEPAGPRAIFATMAELVRTLSWINRHRPRPLQLRELEMLKQGRTSFCQAAAGTSVAVHPDGTLYPCGQTMGDVDLSLGSLDAPDFCKLAALGAYRLQGEECRGCSLQEACPGECPSRLKYNGPGAKARACAMWKGLAGASGLSLESNPIEAEHGNAAA